MSIAEGRSPSGQIKPFTCLEDGTLITSGSGFSSAATLTRAANQTPYAANDVVGGVLTFAVANGVSGNNLLLNQIEFIWALAALPSGMNAALLYLYDATPGSAIADNGAFSLPSGDRANCLTPEGISLSSFKLATGGGSVVSATNNLGVQVQLVNANLFAYLVTQTAYTPAANSETSIVRMRGLFL